MNRDRPYTIAEIRFLRENVDKITNEELGQHIGRSKAAVNAYMSTHGISRSGPLWTQEQLEYLKAHYADGYVKDIMNGTHHGWKFCQAKAKQLGLERLKVGSSEWTHREVKLFDEMMERGASYAEMEQVLHRSRDSLQWRKTTYYPGYPTVPSSPKAKG